MKIFKRIAVFLLALVLVSGAADTELSPGSLLPTASAADSPVAAPVTDGGTTGGKVTIHVDVSTGGNTYAVDVIGTGTITKKYKLVTLELTEKTKVGPSIAKTKKAKKTKKIVIKAKDGQKLTASQFNKKAYKGFKGKIVVKKSAMSKKEFKKLVKKLRKGGFKGKIKRV